MLSLYAIIVASHCTFYFLRTLYFLVCMFVCCRRQQSVSAYTYDSRITFVAASIVNTTRLDLRISRTR